MEFLAGSKRVTVRGRQCPPRRRTSLLHRTTSGPLGRHSRARRGGRADARPEPAASPRPNADGAGWPPETAGGRPDTANGGARPAAYRYDWPGRQAERPVPRDKSGGHSPGGFDGLRSGNGPEIQFGQKSSIALSWEKCKLNLSCRSGSLPVFASFAPFQQQPVLGVGTWLGRCFWLILRHRQGPPSR